MTTGWAIPTAHWKLVAYAGVCGAVGLLSFTSMLAAATKHNVSTLFLVANLVQVAVAAANQAHLSGGLSAQKAGGYFLALVATFLLVR